MSNKPPQDELIKILNSDFNKMVDVERVRLLEIIAADGIIEAAETNWVWKHDKYIKQWRKQS
jgi:hypothetical protein